MTVGELRKLLVRYPDDLPVALADWTGYGDPSLDQAEWATVREGWDFWRHGKLVTLPQCLVFGED